MSGAAALPPHSTDSFLGGRVVLVQPKKGHRAGLDAALLQAVVPADASGLVVDMGAGVGTVAFCAAARAPGLIAVALERDPALVAMARQALLLPANAGFSGRVRPVEADASEPAPLRRELGAKAADWVLMNPPFDTPGGARQSPDPGRREAHLGRPDLLRAWCQTAARILRPGGALGLIHRAEALPTVLQAMAGAFGGIRVLPAHPSSGAAANRVVVTGERASRSPFRLLPGLVLHEAGGGWTPEADAILKGRAALAI